MDPSHHTNEANPIPTNDNTTTDSAYHDDEETLGSDLVTLLEMFSTFSDAMEEEEEEEEEERLQAVGNGGGGLYFSVADLRGFIEDMLSNEYEMMRDATMMNNQHGVELTMGPISATPASESSIEALEKVTVVEQKEEKGGESTMGKFECSICFEGSSNDPEASRMPCSHLFHSKCIICWLHTRNTCPLCRFEMPTGDEK